jgi:hypothetical protein
MKASEMYGRYLKEKGKENTLLPAPNVSFDDNAFIRTRNVKYRMLEDSENSKVMGKCRFKDKINQDLEREDSQKSWKEFEEE